MIYKYQNITTNVTTIDPNYVEHTGETVLTLPSSLIAELIENACTFSQFFLEYEQEELYNELEQDLDVITEHFKNLDSDVEVRNADAIIGIYEYALDNNDKEFSLNVDTENISWVIHDILHAVNDASGCTIYVESTVERERILESLRITQEQFPNELPDYDFLENLESEFHSRFNEFLHLDEFKVDEYDEEDEY